MNTFRFGIRIQAGRLQSSPSCKKITICRRQGTVEIPALSTAQMAEVDRQMISDYGIELIQMMEKDRKSTRLNLCHSATIYILAQTIHK